MKKIVFVMRANLKNKPSLLLNILGILWHLVHWINTYGFVWSDQNQKLSENRFVYIFVDDFQDILGFSFLQHKDEAFSFFNVFRERVEKEKDFWYYTFEVIEVASLSTDLLLLILKKIELKMSFHVLELHNKMESSKKKD